MQLPHTRSLGLEARTAAWDSGPELPRRPALPRPLCSEPSEQARGMLVTCGPNTMHVRGLVPCSALRGFQLDGSRAWACWEGVPVGVVLQWPPSGAGACAGDLAAGDCAGLSTFLLGAGLTLLSRFCRSHRCRNRNCCPFSCLLSLLRTPGSAVPSTVAWPRSCIPCLLMFCASPLLHASPVRVTRHILQEFSVSLGR